MSNKFDDYIQVIENTGSGHYNITVTDPTDFTIVFSEEITSCTVVEEWDGGTIFFPTLDTIDVRPNKYVDENLFWDTLSRFRFRYFRKASTSEEENTEKGRNRVFTFKLTYVTDDDVEHEYKFNVYYQYTHSDYSLNEVDVSDYE